MCLPMPSSQGLLVRYLQPAQPYKTNPRRTWPRERGHTHRYSSAFISPTLSGSVPLSDMLSILLRMRRPLSCTQGHAHSPRCLRCLTVTAQLAVRVPRHSRAHSAAMGIWLTGSAWVLVWLHPPPYSLVPFGTVRMSSTQKPCYTGLQRTAHCVCAEQQGLGIAPVCTSEPALEGGSRMRGAHSLLWSNE